MNDDKCLGGGLKAMVSEQRLKHFERTVEAEIREDTFWFGGTVQESWTGNGGVVVDQKSPQNQ